MKKNNLDQTPPFLEVRNLSLSFSTYKKGLQKTQLQVIKDFNIAVNKGEILAVVGASGAGKSLLADAIFGILPEHAHLNGEIRRKGENLSKTEIKKLRGNEFILIPQSVKALNPLIKVGKQIKQAMPKMLEKEKNKVLESILNKLDLDFSTSRKYPHELSGGMARRILIGIAMASPAQLIVADEPTPGLDEQTRSSILKHLTALKKEGRAIIFITHDIDAAVQIAEKVAVFYNGESIDLVNAKNFSGTGKNLKHPYTKALWKALPQNDFTIAKPANFKK